MLMLDGQLSRRLLLTLCMGLALVFAFASPASTLDKLQHSAGISAEHTHLFFGSLSMDEGHSHDHGDDRPLSGQPDSTPDDGTPDHMPGSHHHHHSDGGAFQTHADAVAVPWNAARGAYLAEPDRQVVPTAVRGPDRPPKLALTNI